jgi:hypothetical protein
MYPYSEGEIAVIRARMEGYYWDEPEWRPVDFPGEYAEMGGLEPAPAVVTAADIREDVLFDLLTQDANEMIPGVRGLMPRDYHEESDLDEVPIRLPWVEWMVNRSRWWREKDKEKPDLDPIGRSGVL